MSTITPSISAAIGPSIFDSVGGGRGDGLLNFGLWLWEDSTPMFWEDNKGIQREA